MSENQRKGIVVVVSGPSGVGKGSVNKRLIEECKNLSVAVSATTRAPRQGEVHGKDYYFISKQAFNERVANNDFAEYALVHGNMYGTLISEIKKCVDFGKDVILEIDVQGGRSIKKSFDDCISIFILPPNMEELAIRLNGRATDDAEEIKQRLITAEEEVKCVYDYDYAVVNDDLDECIGEIKSIIEGEKLRVKNRKYLIDELLKGGVIG